mmetsp:Transcript_28692/g.54191  ORF Transcript_28692/g.54191 Transcript_28692/m.54191 type:complete len:88 (-) Transcript_28692:160-423(-)
MSPLFARPFGEVWGLFSEVLAGQLVWAAQFVPLSTPWTLCMPLSRASGAKPDTLQSGVRCGCGDGGALVWAAAHCLHGEAPQRRRLR